MLPRWHIIFGALFALFIWYTSPFIGIFNITLIFLASFLIDFDHYVVFFMKTGKLSLWHAFDYHKKRQIKEEAEIRRGIRRKGDDFHLFHTIEFHVLIGFLGILWTPFLYIFIGMVFHSLLDLIDGLYYGKLHRREYFFFNWLRKKF